MPKTVLITGCSPGGIGHALALEFHAKDYTVFATARKTTTIASLQDLGIITLPLEVTNASSIASLKAEVSNRTNGTLDMLVNNAGRNYAMPALDVDLEEARQTFDANVFAVMAMCQVFAPLLIESKGTIVQLGSLAAVMPYAFSSVYNASKAALHSYSDTLRVELAPLGVKVVTVVTGGVKSNLARTHRTLPEGSVYVAVADEYEKRQTHSQALAVGNEDYARRVVGQLVGSPGKDTIWEGGKSWLVYYGSFLPRWVFDMWMTRTFNLWKLNNTDGKKTR